MKSVVLLVGRLPNVIANVANQLEDLPIQWLGAHNRDEVIRQLDDEPQIECVIIGSGLDDTIRGNLVAIIAQRRPDLCIHIKDRSSGPEGMAPFVRRMVQCDVLPHIVHI